MICAHSRNVLGERHDLVAHLRAVAERAAEFAAALAASEPAYWLGLWHDLGKFHPDFQAYLAQCEAEPRARGRGPDHKAAGATLAQRHLGLLALLIQGHHGGLRTPTDFKTWLDGLTTGPAVHEALARARAALPDLEPAVRPALPPAAHERRSAELFLRLLFSALVDADYLDTERHFQPERAAQRGRPVGLEVLWERLTGYQMRHSGIGSDAVAQARHAIYEACLAAADQPPGLFRLTVPTGGGKTRSGMAFGLRHALQHGQRRVIVAVPFITITEQTADVYRAIFEDGPESEPVVLEHHSGGLGAGDEGDDFHAHAVWARLAAENWDAPIVVTTTVQLFESLFGCSTSSSRKLHRLARSVIVLDEAQALPSHLLTPLLDALRELCARYGTTVVLSTATQPAFEVIEPFAALPATEIVPEPARFFRALQRVEYDWRTATAVSWTEVAAWLRAEPQALAVVNTKRDALALLDALGDPDALHLSTLLCGAHRRRVIAEIRTRLAAGAPCRLVSTQVIEAGVDLDFPLVARALGPLDGMIQAAGRCNREGRLARGRVIVFQPAEGGLPPGAYRTAAGVTRALLGRGALDPDDPDVARAYFRQLYQTVDTDAQRIQPLREAFDYPEVARRFRLIADDTTTVVAPYGDTAERHHVANLIERLRRGAPDSRAILRALQPYLVTVRTREAARHARRGLIAPIVPGVGEWLGAYHPVHGLVGDDPSPDALVV